MDRLMKKQADFDLDGDVLDGREVSARCRMKRHHSGGIDMHVSVSYAVHCASIDEVRAKLLDVNGCGLGFKFCDEEQEARFAAWAALGD